MGKRRPPPQHDPQKRAALEQAVQQGRARAEQLLGERREHLARVESTLCQQIERWLAELATGQGESEQLRTHVEERLRLLRQLESQVAAESAKLREWELELNLTRDELATTQTVLSRRAELLDERERSADAENLHHEQLLADTKAQRRRIAAEFRAQRSAWQAEKDLQRRELERVKNRERQQADAEIARLEREVLTLHAELDQARVQANDSAMADELARSQCESQERTDQLVRAHDALEAALAERQRFETAQAAWESERARWTTERETLQQQLAAAKAQPAPVPEETARRHEDMQRRFEMAVQDVRELKRKNSDLEEQLREVRKSGAAPAAAPGKLDWEAQKKRLLSMLEETADDDSMADERLTLEGAIHITDNVVAERDRERDELKARIAELEAAPQTPPVVDPEIAAFVDRDAAVQAERTRLAQLQDEWREKLKQAEIDISLERAKIARDRADIEDKLRKYEEDQARLATTAPEPTSGSQETKKPSRGRWLARLGLKDDGTESG